ncbi:cytoskeletal protein RodZ [Cytobacillus eiseniae]|uniref:Cytoskeletal protein RodZ n=1 Tax=Cytobacillus eiseniae TaxID=762947 RepID=A0ABS4RC94_9BACI|nr:YrrS family protein [Cytobacillus eiseniae]MBP2240511.1 cytoskeletal protein RodZ [Cytobacillus eiseniae]
MNRKNDSSSRELRSELRGKRRKTNLILNTLIGLVILLIIFVSVKIFSGGNDEKLADQEQQTESSQDEEKVAAEESNASPIDEHQDEKEIESDENSLDESEKNAGSTDDKKEEITIVPANEDDAVVTEGGSNNNVKKTIENPSWAPIGTSQTGEHYAVYDKESTDWAEMLQAMSYATGVDQNNMNVWFLGNNGFNKSVGTITTKDQKQVYRVYIDWIDGQGWKPTKVEELNEVEKKPTKEAENEDS